MPWMCPACQLQIHHSPLEDRPRRGVVYRCHACRLELVLNEDGGKFAVPSTPTETTPFSTNPTTKPPFKRR